MIKWGEITIKHVPLELDGTPYDYNNKTSRLYIADYAAQENFGDNPCKQTTACCGSVMVRMDLPNIWKTTLYDAGGFPHKIEAYFENDSHKGITVVINDEKNEIVMKETDDTVVDEFILDSGDKIKFFYKLGC